jgi:alcohol dehydrogenase
MAGVQPAIELAYEILKRGGQLTIASLPDPSARFALPLANLVGDERAIVGSYMGSCSPHRDIPRFLELYRQGRLPVDRLRSAEHKLESINAGFDRLARGEAVRDLVVFG